MALFKRELNGGFPRMAKVRQEFAGPELADPEEATRRELARPEIAGLLAPGQRIAVAVGSRGIASLAAIVRAVVETLRAAGGLPFIVPAMGSHGGATGAGQVGILRHYGLKEEELGVPVEGSLEVTRIGTLEGGTPVYFSTRALSADGVVVVNRVKPHTDFRGEIESGLLKMLVIGLGKQAGASAIHAVGAANLHWAIPAAARIILAGARVLFGVAIVENAYERVALVRAVPGARLEEEEKELLRQARQWLPRFPVDEFDVLIVDEIGKDISGTGMDPNIIGRYRLWGVSQPARPRIRRIVALDLTAASEGNAAGLALADITTRRLFEKIDFRVTYTNVLAAHAPEMAQVPLLAETDREAVGLALGLVTATPEKARVIRIQNTLRLGEIEVSESILEEIAGRPGVQLLSAPKEMRFTAEGRLV